MSTVPPVPPGMHTVTPHLVCVQAAEAMEFYRKAFNAEILGQLSGPDGKLIWSHEEEKLRQLLGVEDQRYQFVRRESKWVLQTTLSDGRKLAGWLEPNSENARRPLAKFAVTGRE